MNLFVIDSVFIYAVCKYVKRVFVRVFVTRIKLLNRSLLPIFVGKTTRVYGGVEA